MAKTFLDKIKGNAAAFSAMAGCVGLVFGAWFAVEKSFTRLDKHQALASEVQSGHQVLAAEIQKAAANLERLRLLGEIRSFQQQLRTVCVTAQQQSTDYCRWLKDEIANMERQLKELPR